MQKDAYIAINPETRIVENAVIAESTESGDVDRFIKDGLIVERVTRKQARELMNKKIPDDWVI